MNWYTRPLRDREIIALLLGLVALALVVTYLARTFDW